GSFSRRPMRTSICYDLGFGTGRWKMESKRLRHENGSAILRKCPPVAGGSVAGARLARIHRLARTSILKRKQAGGTTLHTSNRTYHRVAAIAIMGAVILTGTAQFAQAQATGAPAAQAPAAQAPAAQAPAAPAPAPGAPPEKKVKD